MRVYKYVMSNGDQMVSLVDQDSFPDAYPSYYITSELYLDNHSVNTMEKRVYELRFFLEWLDHVEIDIVNRVECGKFLVDSEVNNFIDVAKLKRSELYTHQNNVVQLNVTDKRVSNAIACSAAIKQRVNAKTTNGRIDTAVNYIEFLRRELHTGIMPDQAVHSLYRTTKSLKRSRLRISNYVMSGKKYDGFNSVLPDDIFYKMLEIIAPVSPLNPFKHNRKRNQLIIEILASTGIRRGALAKLKITDITFSGDANRLYVRRTPEDPTDTRKHKPQQKTREHCTYIAPYLVADIQSYITNTRAIVPGALAHEFIFISELDTQGTQGNPLSLASINYIFDVLSKTLETRVTPHMLRHKWNEVFTDQTAHLSDSEADKRRIDAMGWSKASTMPARYNHFKNLQKSYEVQKLIQQEIFHKDSEI